MFVVKLNLLHSTLYYSFIFIVICFHSGLFDDPRGKIHSNKFTKHQTNISQSSAQKTNTVKESIQQTTEGDRDGVVSP